MRTELRINEIMLEKNVDRNTAETLFEQEVIEKYDVKDIEVAKALFTTNVKI